MSIVQGKNCAFQINTTGEYLTVLCAKSFTLTVETETKETTTRGDGGWRNFDYKTLSYTVSLSGIMKLNDPDAKPVFTDLLAQQINFLEVPYRMLYLDTEGFPTTITGTVIITRSLINTPAGALVETDTEMIGKGSLSMSTGCDLIATGIDYATTATENLYTVTPVYEGTASVDHWLMIVNGVQSTHTGPSWTYTFTPGNYHIEVIPYCSEEIAGISFEEDRGFIGPP